MNKFKRLWVTFSICVMLVANVSVCGNAEQQDRITIADSKGMWQIDVTVDDALKEAQVMRAQCTETIDADAAADLLLSSDEKARTKREKVNYASYNRANTLYNATDIRIEDNGEIEIELFSYKGHFSYTRSLPDEYTRRDYESGYGILSDNGIAAKCGIIGDDAQKTAQELLSKLEIPFEYRPYAVRAYSPSNDTYLTVGYYDVIFQQVINQVPVAIYNSLPYRENPGAPTYYPEYSYGITVRVFESGVYSISCEWLTGMQQEQEQLARLSLNQAVDCFAAYFANNPNADISPKPMQIDSICLEYAVCGSTDAYLLIPSWTFTGDRNQTKFYGLRISAVDGSTILFDGYKQ